MEKWINKLFDRVVKLRHNSRVDDPNKSEIELNKCISFLNKMVSDARHQNISINRIYFNEMIKIQDVFVEIEANIKKKRNTVWVRVKKGLKTVLDLVSVLLGFGNITGLLEGDGPKLLE